MSQKSAVFLQRTFRPLQQLLQEHGLSLAPVSGPRLGAAIHRTWKRYELITEFENLIHELAAACKLQLAGYDIPVCLSSSVLSYPPGRYITGEVLPAS